MSCAHWRAAMETAVTEQPRCMIGSRVRRAMLCLLAAVVPGAIAPAYAQSPDASTAQAADTRAQPSVGTDTRAFEDPQRRNWTGTGQRPLRTMLWYPAAGIAFRVGNEADDSAAMPANASTVSAAGTRLPLILVSHGSGSQAAHMDWLARTLAMKGYLVASVDHSGSAEEELHSRPTPSDHFGWERAIDLRTVLDLLLEDPAFGPMIDRQRIGAAGFSLGGTTVLWLAGARLDLENLRHSAPPMPPAIAPAIERLLQLPETSPVAREAQARAEQSHRDPRIRSVFALAPAMGFGFNEAGLRGIEVPVRIVVGRDDPVTPPATNARVFANGIAGAGYVELPGERGHYTARTPEDVRTAELAEVAASAVAFFGETLASRGGQ